MPGTKVLALIPSFPPRLLSCLVAGSNLRFCFVLGNIVLIIIFLYSSALGPDKLRGSKSLFLSSGRRSSDRVTLPGESDPGLSRFRGETGDVSRFRFAIDNEVEIVAMDEGFGEDGLTEDMFEFGEQLVGSVNGRVGIA